MRFSKLRAPHASALLCGLMLAGCDLMTSRTPVPGELRLAQGTASLTVRDGFGNPHELKPGAGTLELKSALGWDGDWDHTLIWTPKQGVGVELKVPRFASKRWDAYVPIGHPGWAQSFSVVVREQVSRSKVTEQDERDPCTAPGYCYHSTFDGRDLKRGYGYHHSCDGTREVRVRNEERVFRRVIEIRDAAHRSIGQFREAFETTEERRLAVLSSGSCVN